MQRTLESYSQLPNRICLRPREEMSVPLQRQFHARMSHDRLNRLYVELINEPGKDIRTILGFS